MNEMINQPLPEAYKDIRDATEASGFTMASDIMTCSLLRTLAVSKPSGKFLELGTGTGLSASWILDGMDNDSTLVSIDNEPSYQAIAKKFLGDDKRLELQCIDSEAWFKNNSQRKFDYIFADTWHGKYLLLNEALAMLNKGGFYIIDDMLVQPNWPEGHYEKATDLVSYLESREDLLITKLQWATGLIIAAKR